MKPKFYLYIINTIMTFVMEIKILIVHLTKLDQYIYFLSSIIFTFKNRRCHERKPRNSILPWQLRLQLVKSFYWISLIILTACDLTRYVWLQTSFITSAQRNRSSDKLCEATRSKEIIHFMIYLMEINWASVIFITCSDGGLEIISDK